MSTCKAYDKWLLVLQEKSKGKAWTEGEIIYFRKAIGIAGIQDGQLRINLRNAFYHYMPDVGYKITTEQSEKGRNYLLAKSLKKNGQFRKGNKLGSRELSILKTLKEHRLIELYDASTNMYGHYYYPVYRAISKSKETFEYTGIWYEALTVVG